MLHVDPVKTQKGEYAYVAKISAADVQKSKMLKDGCLQSVYLFYFLAGIWHLLVCELGRCRENRLSVQCLIERNNP